MELHIAFHREQTFRTHFHSISSYHHNNQHDSMQDQLLTALLSSVGSECNKRMFQHTQARDKAANCNICDLIKVQGKNDVGISSTFTCQILISDTAEPVHCANTLRSQWLPLRFFRVTNTSENCSDIIASALQLPLQSAALRIQIATKCYAPYKLFNENYSLVLCCFFFFENNLKYRHDVTSSNHHRELQLNYQSNAFEL